jgi:hypothetical protein
MSIVEFTLTCCMLCKLCIRPYTTGTMQNYTDVSSYLVSV